MYIVRGVKDPSQCDQDMTDLRAAIAKISKESNRQQRAVDVQGDKAKKRWYKSVQACSEKCNCKYEFDGTGRHDVYSISDIPVLQSYIDWLHGLGKVEDKLRMNEVLANIYDHEEDENIPWHSDENGLYETSTDVLSWSVGSPGIFCFRPRVSQGDETWLMYLAH